MVRQLRIDGPGVLHHVHNRGARRQAIFLDDRDRRRFLGLLGDALHRHAGTLHAYCLMGNHFHLLMQTRHGDLDRIMQLAMSRFVRGFNQRHGYDGPLFTDRYSSHPVEDDQYAITLFRYIHRNPADIEGVDLATYRWSSLPAFLNPSRRQAWLNTDLGLAYFADDRRAFAEFVLGESDQALLDEVCAPNGLEAIEVTLAIETELVHLVALASEVTGVPAAQLTKPSGGRRAPQRVLMAHLALRLLEADRDVLAGWLGYRSGHVMATVAGRFDALAVRRPDIAVQAEAIASAWRRGPEQRARTA